jgi:hypothetical protein
MTSQRRFHEGPRDRRLTALAALGRTPHEVALEDQEDDRHRMVASNAAPSFSGYCVPAPSEPLTKGVGMPPARAAAIPALLRRRSHRDR